MHSIFGCIIQKKKNLSSNRKYEISVRRRRQCIPPSLVIKMLMCFFGMFVVIVRHSYRIYGNKHVMAIDALK